MLSLEEMKANRRTWVEALRSGKYRQGRSYLRDERNQLCCLGVLAEIAGCQWSGGDNNLPYFISVEGKIFDTVAPPQATDFVGLRTALGRIDGEDVLAFLNDDGKSFDEIADIIESEPKGLFVESVS